MTRRTFLQLAAVALPPDEFRKYAPDPDAWAWMKEQIPFFTCPDRDMEEIYYYRWSVLRKHIEQTPRGLLITEFLKPVKHAGEYNALSCALGHHLAEARWLHDPTIAEGDARFWLHGGEDGGLHPRLHQFSGWTAAARYDVFLANGNRASLVNDLDALGRDYVLWEQERLSDSGLFWQHDVADGMEESISGGRRVRNLRPSINSYMYGNANAIAAIAKIAGKTGLAAEYQSKAEKLRALVSARLWNTSAEFFETVLESGKSSDVREEIGFTPWYFDLPENGKGFETAWRQLMDPKGFLAPYGPTTAEQRHPAFKITYEGDDCQWNGPSWPFATTITLKALANVLHHYRQDAIDERDYWRTFAIYTKSQHMKQDDGRIVPWIDEDLNPFTGEWQARAAKIRKGTFYGRGDHYNHSGYADLVITGLVGLHPRADDTVEVNPLARGAGWDWFCLDRLPYHGRKLTIVWDRTGRKFGKGKGLAVYADAREIVRGPTLARLTGHL